MVRLPQKEIGRRPSGEAAPAWLLFSEHDLSRKPVSAFPDHVLSPPEGFFGLGEDVAPRQADVVEVALGPLSQFVASAITLTPDVQRVADRPEEARNMMISHRFVCASRHF